MPRQPSERLRRLQAWLTKHHPDLAKLPLMTTFAGGYQMNRLLRSWLERLLTKAHYRKAFVGPAFAGLTPPKLQITSSMTTNGKLMRRRVGSGDILENMIVFMDVEGYQIINQSNGIAVLANALADRAKVITVVEAATLIGCDQSTVTRASGKGKIDGSYRDKADNWMVPYQSALAFKKGYRKPAPKKPAKKRAKVWECTGCAEAFPGVAKPAKCPKCGSSSFK